MSRIGRRTILKGASVASAGLAVTPLVGTPAVARETHHWRMVTSWPKQSPGPGQVAERLAARLHGLSGGRLRVTVYGAGEIVPAFEVFDAVGLGVAEMGHSAAFFWQGKLPAAVFYTTVPFGLTAWEHDSWLHYGGGQELWDRLYADFGVRAFAAGNAGMQMGGWFKREIGSVADLRGLKMRIPGLGGEVLRQLGVQPLTLPPGEIFAALRSGVVDAAEFLGPATDRAMGFARAATHYYGPGFNKPNGSAECLINRAAYARLDGELQAAVAAACRAEDSLALAEAEYRNAAALAALQAEGIDIAPWPEDVVMQARDVAREVKAAIAGRDALARQIVESYAAAEAHFAPWSGYAMGQFLRWRQ